MSRLTRSRFLSLFIVPNMLFAAVAWWTDAVDLIPVLNAAVLAGAGGVCLAYLPAVLDSLFAQRPFYKSDWLALGIFCSWFGVIVTRLWSIAWRMLGQPMWLANSDIVSYGLFLSVSAAVFHMAAPGALEGRRVPTERWIRIGILFAAAIFVAILVLYVADDLADLGAATRYG